MYTISFFTLGCRLNKSESSSMMVSLQNKGYTVTEDSKQADIFVINSCTVTNQAVRKCRQLARNLKRNNPLSKIFLVGCWAQTDVEGVKKELFIDHILGNAEKFNIAQYIQRLTTGKSSEKIISVGKRVTSKSFKLESAALNSHYTRANLKIQDGCDFFCSFCIIPFARGRAHSRNFDNLIAEATHLANVGYKELILTGVNIGLYSDSGINFLQLIKNLAKIDSLRRIRISSIEPTTIGNELIQMMTNKKYKLAPHLHLPLQSGSGSTLEAMRRRYTPIEFLDFIKNAKKILPSICVGTDVIVGFPSESDQLFKESYDFLKEAPVDYFHVFPYSKRNGTAASKMPLQFNSSFLKPRVKKLRDLSRTKWHTYCLDYLNTKHDVIFEEQIANNVWQGYTENYIRVSTYGDNLKNFYSEVLLTDFNHQFSTINAKLI